MNSKLQKAICIFIIPSLFFVISMAMPFYSFSNTYGIEHHNGTLHNKDAEIKYENYIYEPQIKTVRFHPEKWPFSNPLLLLHSNEKLLLVFDELDAPAKQYEYTIIHCTANWKPTDLPEHEYIDGFFTDYIYDYEFSRATLQPYVHYELLFPTENMKPKISGNYILVVYQENKEKPVLTQRFTVYEKLIDIDASVKRATLVEDRFHKQEIDFKILHNNYQINYPYEHLKVVITKNHSWDNANTNLKPRFVKNNVLDYNYEKENSFPGGNEYREFDIKTLRSKTIQVNDIVMESDRFHVKLRKDEKRTFKNYIFKEDLNGMFHINADRAVNSDIEADYVWVYFTLDGRQALLNGNIFIYGELTNWQMKDENRMIYDPNEQSYKCKLLLKQGFYNYIYVYSEDPETGIDEQTIEGSHYETENLYTIYIYNYEISEFYDRLIGVKRINSVIEENQKK